MLSGARDQHLVVERFRGMQNMWGRGNELSRRNVPGHGEGGEVWGG